MVDNNLHTDKALFDRISKGDESAFSRIFQHYYQNLFWYTLKMLKSEFWAEEVVQEVFAQLWFSRNNLSNVENPSSYLFRMATNKALDHIRKNERKIKMEYFIFNQHANIDLAEKTDEWNQIDKWLIEAIESLPEQRRRIYQLKYQKGLSYEEIAQQLSITKNTVRNHMVKALESLRHYLLLRKNILSFFFILLY